MIINTVILQIDSYTVLCRLITDNPPQPHTQGISLLNQTNRQNPLRPESFSAVFHNRLLRSCTPAS